MARVRYDEVDQYTTNTTNFFQLKEDRDVATVRILYNNVDDIEAHSLHRVKINGRDKWVECLRQINDSVEVCPLCASGNKIQLRVFVPLYIEDDGSVKLWERGKKFIDKLTSYVRVIILYAHNQLKLNVMEQKENKLLNIFCFQ